jgi:hypothetical protein
LHIQRSAYVEFQFEARNALRTLDVLGDIHLEPRTARVAVDPALDDVVRSLGGDGRVSEGKEEDGDDH